jgi:hypothetical protein
VSRLKLENLGESVDTYASAKVTKGIKTRNKEAQFASCQKPSGHYQLGEDLKSLNQNSVAKPNFLTSLLNSVDDPDALRSRMDTYKASPSPMSKRINKNDRLPEI